MYTPKLTSVTPDGRVEADSSVERLVRCVHSGYLDGGCSCPATVPASAVGAAWARQLEYADVHEDQFFRFMWRGGAWLGYGLRDGDVRGVYCPEHSAERAERSSVQSAVVAS
jgi:hypothetical protein